MIEGRAEIAQHEFLVRDDQLMVYIPGGEGGSEPLSLELLRRLFFLWKLIAENVEVDLDEELRVHGT